MPTESFLRISDIEGDSTDEAFKGAIEVLGYSWGASQAGPFVVGGAGATGKVATNDLSCVYRPGKASPELFSACVTGRHLKEAVLISRHGGATSSFKFYDLLISSFENGSSAGDEPTDRVTITFSRVEIEYSRQKPDGTSDSPIIVGYDIKLNREI